MKFVLLLVVVLVTLLITITTIIVLLRKIDRKILSDEKAQMAAQKEARFSKISQLGLDRAEQNKTEDNSRTEDILKIEDTPKTENIPMKESQPELEELANIKAIPHPENDLQIIDMDTLALKKDELVIGVSDVTMEFRIASEQTSGIKDYIIRLLKREISYRKLYALDHVSFNVYKGEIVGIIGTNGSGKSTMLKIVSGALKPTHGRVKVDRRKVQLLTLGTGFDMELTGRENIYLNGAIIGYSKDFLDAHFDEIVEFAELEDFIDEKVKNYSSGMVSRLGFAIATVADAAEILILDEVLSVGDEFFRRKSLKRVQEMIHSGSTVLMVSHSMSTIIENCTKCIWIEKGKLKMIGVPKTVCEAYIRMGRKDSQSERERKEPGTWE